MPIDISEFHEELFQEVHTSANVDGRYLEDSFFEILTGHLIDAGEIETADRTYYVAQSRGSQGAIRVDGYGGDPILSDNVLSLIITDFSQDLTIRILTRNEMDVAFRRLSNFLERSLDDRFRNELEETSPAFGLADLIATRWQSVSRVRLFLVTNKQLSARIDGREEVEVSGVPVTHSVWDLGRIHRYAMSGLEREEILVDLEECGGPLVLLPAQFEHTDYESYLAVFPGKQLASIYDRWGARLLEQNVRVFLQARGNVNRGIRNTIENNPEMFFAYNNGITATAESVETEESSKGLLLTGMRNFQIVNGGQTTASIHAALRNKSVDLDRVFVQMKLSIVDPVAAVEVVPKISEYANSQNRVSAADFFSNHPFHVRMEGFSRRMFAPSKDGSFQQTKWFYERARGQYQDARGQLSRGERRRFDQEFPKNQVFTKTDLAKFLNVWDGKPDTVSKGAQKNFADFASSIGKQWRKKNGPDNFNERYFQESMAKSIVFKAVERLVTEQDWYQGGYRANVVAYAIAKLAHDVGNRSEFINFDRVWRQQGISAGLRDCLKVAAAAVHEVLTNPIKTTSNVTEWAKQQACWSRVMALQVNWPESLEHELLTSRERAEANRAAVRDQRELNGIEAQTAVVTAGPEFWMGIKEWGVLKGLLSPDDTGVLDVAKSIPERIPTEKQSERAIEILHRLQDEGCQLELNHLGS